MNERLQIPTTQLFEAMDNQLAEQQQAAMLHTQTAEADQAQRAAKEREKQAAELQRAWQNPTVMAKYREREAGLVADTEEVRDVITQSQTILATKERRNPSNTLEAEGRVETEKVKGIHGKIIHDTEGGFARQFARDAAADPRHYTESARKARQELNSEVRRAASDKSLTRRIGELKKELTKAQDNQEDFKARQLEQKLTEAREELIVQRALAAERKAAAAKKAAEERVAAIRKGVKALDRDEKARNKASKVDRNKVDQGTLGVLDGLNGAKQQQKITGSETPTDANLGTETAAVDAPDPELVALDDNRWAYQVVDRINALARKAGISINREDQQELALGIIDASKTRKNTQAELEEIADLALRYVADKEVNAAAARDAEDHAARAPEQAGTSGAGGRDAEAESDATEAPKDHESLNNFDVRVGLAEKPLKGEDASLVDEQNGVYAVFDGLGGHRGGDIASKNARDAISSYFAHRDAPSTIEEAVQQMKEAFSAARQAVPDGGAEGLTTAAVTRVVDIEGQKYLVAGNAGDSRVILYRDGQLTDITQEQGSGNVVDNCFGSRVDDHLKDEFTYMKLQNGDKVLVSSDGITGDWEHQFLSDAEFADAFGQADPQASADRFIELSKKHDDKTAIVLFVGEKGVVPQEDAPEPPVDDEAQATPPDGVIALRALLKPASGLPAPAPGSQDKRFGQVRAFLADAGRRTNDRFIDTLSWLNRRRGRVALAVGALVATGVGVTIYNALKQGDTATIAGLVQPPKSGSGSGSGEAAAIAAQKIAEKAQRVQELGVVNVPKGGTYIDTIGQWAAAHGVKMSGSQSTEVYHHLAQLFPDGNFFTEAGESYSMGVGEFGINKPGAYHVRPEVMAAIAQKAQEMGLDAEDILTKLK